MIGHIITEGWGLRILCGGFCKSSRDGRRGTKEFGADFGVYVRRKDAVPVFDLDVTVMIVLGVQSVWVWIGLRRTRYPLFRVRRALVVIIDLVFIIFLDEGGEQAGSTRVDTGFESVRGLSFVSRVSSTGQALLQAPRHGDRFVLPVNLWVALAQPCVPE